MNTTDELSKRIGDWLEVFMQRSMRDFKDFMDESGLSYSQVNILLRLIHSPCSGISDIGETMGVSDSAASQAIDRLVEKGLVERSEDTSDRRVKILKLSAKGHSLIRDSIHARSKWAKELSNTLSSEQKDKVISALILLTEAAQKTRG